MSTKAIIIAIICGIFGIGGLGWYVYDNGYDNGVSYVNAQVAAERLQWQKKINELQISSDSKSLNDAFGFILNGIVDIKAVFFAGTEEFFDIWGINGSRDD